jgi:hypothetical protein
MATDPEDPGDDDALPLGEDELQAIALRAAVVLDTPPGAVTPDPRPRRDALVEAYDSVRRLVRETRRLRRRETRARDALRAAAATGDPAAMRAVIEDVLDDTV